MSAPVLLEGVKSVLNSWHAYRVCLEHGYDGPMKNEKAQWMPEAVTSWLTENRDVYPDELEDVLSEILDDVFNTVVEDGSLRQVSEKMCTMQHLCEAGQHQKVLDMISQSTAASVSNVVVRDESPVVEAGSQETSLAALAAACSEASGEREVSSSLASMAIGEENLAEPDGERTDPDGWEVVSKRRKKKH